MYLMHGVRKELSERGFMTASSYGEKEMRQVIFRSLIIVNEKPLEKTCFEHPSCRLISVRFQ